MMSANAFLSRSRIAKAVSKIQSYPGSSLPIGLIPRRINSACGRRIDNARIFDLSAFTAGESRNNGQSPPPSKATAPFGSQYAYPLKCAGCLIPFEVTPMPNDQAGFAVEEFNALRTEILATVKAIENLEKTVGGACAAIYLWLLNKDKAHSELAWLVPVAICLLGGVRALALSHRFSAYSTYVKKIEQFMYGGEGKLQGWEHFHANLRDAGRGWVMTAVVNYAFWIVVLLITIGVAVHQIFF